MFGWPVGDRLAEPPTHQPYLFCFSLSLAKSSKDNEESQDGALEVRRGKNKRLRGPCQQQQINTEVTDVLWAPSAHVPRRFKITHVAPSAGTASLRFVTFPAIWIIRGGFHILAGWSLLPVNVIVHAGLRGYFPGVQIWESMSLIRFWLQRCQGASLRLNFHGCVLDPVPRGRERDEICHLENCCYSSHTSDAASSNNIPSNWQAADRAPPAHVGLSPGFIKMPISLISNSNMCVNQYRALIERATDCKCQD